MDSQLNLIFVLRYRSFLHKNKVELPAIVRGVVQTIKRLRDTPTNEPIKATVSAIKTPPQNEFFPY